MITRKKPGRPKKRADINPVEMYGIVHEPRNPENCVELVYNQPSLFKCIVSIFKEYDSDEIAMEFYHDHIVFAGRDHSRRVNIHITVNANDMNLYYFSPPAVGIDGTSTSGSQRESSSADVETDTDDDDDDDDKRAPSPPAEQIPYYRIIAKRDNLEIVTAIIEKTHYKMTMSLRRDDLSNLFIMLSSCDYDSEDGFEICIVPRAKTATDTIEIPDLASYPLEFTLDSHHLRRKISELKKISPDMIIKKVGNDPLEITFGAVARVIYTGTYKTAAKIKLRSTITPGTVFVSTMSIGRIRPLMAVNIPGGITFFANNVDPIIIQGGMDQRADNHFAIIARLLISTTH